MKPTITPENSPIAGDEALKSWAELLYTHHSQSLPDIALPTGIPENTLKQWAALHHWDKLRRSRLTSKQFQIEQLYDLLEQLTQKLKDTTGQVNPKHADLTVKYTAAIKNLEGEVGIPEIIEVAQLFTTWLRRRNAPLARTITLEFDKFIKQRIQPWE
ncbi:MAG: hypothetical protein EBX41_05655 [Chitinophagia bacterium]|nr:hypothetical protein [Chitinophagia bacterium]